MSVLFSDSWKIPHLACGFAHFSRSNSIENALLNALTSSVVIWFLFGRFWCSVKISDFYKFRLRSCCLVYLRLGLLIQVNFSTGAYYCDALWLLLIPYSILMSDIVLAGFLVFVVCNLKRLSQICNSVATVWWLPGVPTKHLWHFLVEVQVSECKWRTWCCLRIILFSKLFIAFPLVPCERVGLPV